MDNRCPNTARPADSFVDGRGWWWALGHFALREAPFSITPDTAFFYPHEGAQAALNTLLVALRSGEGFLKIVGEVGCGKTVLCRQLLKTLQHECVTAYIPNPDMGPNDLLMALAHELSIELPPPVSRHSVLIALQDCLLRHNAVANREFWVIDEPTPMPLALMPLRCMTVPAGPSGSHPALLAPLPIQPW